MKIKNEVMGIIAVILFGLWILPGCAHYGKRVHDLKTPCYTCGKPLMARCSPLSESGAYTCVCENCGRVYSMRGGKVVK